LQKTSPEADRIREVLKDLVQQNGGALCLDHRKTRKLLLESFPARPPELVALHAAVREGVAADLAQHAGRTLPALSVERFAKRIFEHTGLRMELSFWAVDSWAHALGGAAEQRSRRLQTVPVLHRQRRLSPISRPEAGPYELLGHRRAITGISFSPNGRWIATCSIDRTVRIWDGREGQQKAVLYGGHREWVRSLAYRPDGERMASVGDNGGLRIWDMKSGRRMHGLVGHKAWARSVAYSNDGRLVVSGGQDGLVCLWDSETSELAGKAGPFPGEVSSLAFDTRGRWLAVGCSNRVDLWDPESRKICAQITAYGDRVSVLSLPSGDLLIGDRRGVRQVNPANGATLQQFSAPTGAIHHLALDPGGASLATGGEDQCVRIWDLSEGRQSWAFELRRNITGLSVNKAGSVAIAFGDGKGLLWLMGRGV
jgi:WD40 repeat protein